MARRQGQVCTREDILKQVWDYDFHTGTNVVDVYILHLREKIDRGRKQKLLRTIRGPVISFCPRKKSMQAKKTAFPERKDGLRYDKRKIRLQYATSFQVSLAPVAGQAGDRYARLAVSVQDFVVAHINGNVCYVSAIRTASAREEYQIAGSQVRFRNGLADLGLGSGRTRQVHAVFLKICFMKEEQSNTLVVDVDAPNL